MVNYVSDMKTTFSTEIPQAAPDRIHIDFLTSGSRGNCTLLRYGNRSIAIDIGIGPCVLKRELFRAGITFAEGEPRLDAVFLTHTHSDHLHETVLKTLFINKVSLYAHADHMQTLSHYSYFSEMREAGLIKCYRKNVISPFDNLQILPIALSHDSIATHGFVFHFNQGAFRFGYAADLGFVSDSIISDLSNCDVLGLEFNHDLEMQRNSGRPRYLINRVLGNEGHLSNDQAQDALDKIMYCSTGRNIEQVMLLHRSTQCNQSQLAEYSAKSVIEKHREHHARLALAEQRKYVGTVTALMSNHI